MYTEIIINVNPSETRIAILEEQKLVELLVERNEQRHIVGDIYKGVVDAVIPGMQAAFIDIGLERCAFLHVSDMMNMVDYNKEVFDLDLDEQEFKKTQRKASKPIEQMLHRGQDILVQISKEPIGTKGPRVTTRISMAGRFVVFMPGEHHVGVSRKIKDRDERRRLRKIVRSFNLTDEYGFIVRTATANKSAKEIKADVDALIAVWEGIREKAEKAKPPASVHQEATIISGTVRDLFNAKVNSLVIDSKEEYNRILNYIKTFSKESDSSLAEQIKLYEEDTPIFDAYDIEKQVETAMRRKVWLKSGGYIIVDHTEALVAIDVNTGKFIGKKNQEETIFQTNLEAAKEIARQLRLRDIGGIIVIDFIDMEVEKHKREVLRTLKDAMKNDRSKPKIYKVSELGLIEMTRKRVRPSLIHTFYEPCPLCDGTGRVVSRTTTAMKLERGLRRAAAYSNERDLLIHAHPVVVEYLLEDEEVFVHLKEKYGMKIELETDPTLGFDEFKIFSEKTNEEITSQFTL